MSTWVPKLVRLAPNDTNPNVENVLKSDLTKVPDVSQFRENLAYFWPKSENPRK